MSTVAAMIANAEDRWPSDGEVPGDTLGQVLLASHLLGSDRAVANFGGGNTSAKGRATDHVGREVDVMWVKGSGSDLATMGAEHFTPLRLDEMLVLFEREEMSDEDMVAHLARCQTDPAAPRASIETLLHAFVPAAHVHHTHPDAINVLAGTRDGERLVRECFGDEAAWIPYIRPGFTLARQVGAAVRDDPGLRLVVLAKHGLVVWGDSAQEAYRRTLEAINRAADFVNARTAGTPRFGGPAADDGDALDDDGRREVLRAVLPALRGAVSSERAKVLVVDTSQRAVEFVGSADAADLVTVGAACPDHLVHTKRLPLWIPFDPAREDAGTLVARIRARAEAFRAEYRAYVEAFADETTEPADPDARVVLIQHVGLVGVAPTTKNARLSRDLYHRAIEVMAGAHALGGFTSLDAGESFAVEYWPLELYKLSLAPAPGELQGAVALVTGAAGGIGRAVVESLGAAGACVAAFDLDGDGAAEAVAALGDGGLAVDGDVTSEHAVGDAFRATVEAFGGVDIVVSNAGRGVQRVDRGDDAGRVGAQPRDPGHRLLPRRTRRLRGHAGPGPRGLDRLRGLQERAGGRSQRGGLLVGQGGRAASRALPGRGGRRRGDPRQHGQPRRRPAGLAHLGLGLARGARRRVRDRPRRARGALPPAHHPGRQHPARRHRRGGHALRLAAAVGQEHRQRAQRRRWGGGGLPALSSSAGRHGAAHGPVRGTPGDRRDPLRPRCHDRDRGRAGRTRPG